MRILGDVIISLWICWSSIQEGDYIERKSAMKLCLNKQGKKKLIEQGIEKVISHFFLTFIRKKTLLFHKYFMTTDHAWIFLELKSWTFSIFPLNSEKVSVFHVSQSLYSLWQEVIVCLFVMSLQTHTHTHSSWQLSLSKLPSKKLLSKMTAGE